jgi:putative membrane protein
MVIIGDLIKGFLIGVANIIPGISGGTFALILGIYERLINAVSNIDGRFIKECFSGEIRVALKRIDFWFLLRLVLGAAMAIVLLSRVIEYFLEEQHDPTYAFFIGLIIPSMAIPWKMMQRRRLPEFVWLLAGIIFLLCLSIGFGHLNDHKMELKAQADAMIPGEYNGIWQLFFAAFSGALAISAMILPGISGSFVLLLLGQYKNAVSAVNSRDLFYLGALGLGAVLGALLFTRLLQMLLRKYHSQTIAFLLGLMVASLYVLWPFKKIVMHYSKVHYTSINVLPPLNSNLLLSIFSFVAGFALVWLFIRQSEKYKSKI